MNALRLFFSEMASITKSPKAIIQMIGVMAIPVLYCGMFLYAFWNPYDKTGELPVAVVNQDKGAVLSGQKVKVGNDLVDNLKKNDSFDWEFVSEKQAEKGMEENKYFMTIMIPKGFSKDATTIKDEKITKPPLSYKLNRGYNYTASKMSETGVKEVKNKVANEITKSYVKAMYDKLDQLTDGLKKAAGGAGDLSDGSNKEYNGLIELKKHFGDLMTASAALTNGSVQLAQGSAKLENGLGDLNDGTQKLYNQTSSKTDDIAKLATGANKLADKLDELNKGVTKISKANGKVVNGAEEIQANINKALDDVREKINEFDQLEKKIESFKPLLNDLTNNTDQLEKALTDLNAVIDVVDQNQPQLDAAVNQFVKEHPEVKNDENFKKIIEKKNNMDEIHNDLKHIRSEIGDPEQAAAAAKALTQKLDQYSSIKNKALTQFNQLENAENRLVGGMEQLQKQIDKLPNATAALKEGADRLAEGTESLNKSWPTLIGGIEQLDNGSEKLLAGSKELNTNMQKLADGMGQFSDGASKMNSGVSELKDGAGKLYDGSSELAGKLHNAHDEAAKTPTDDDHADMFAKPVRLTDATHTNVNNNGTGFTPYFLSLGLFVGALMLTVIYDLRESQRPPRSGIGLGLSKYMVMAVMGICQAVIADLVILFGLGLMVNNPMLFVLFSILTSLTFMALIQFFGAALGNPGRFIVVIILILQLTTSGGSYPVQLIPEPLQSVPKWLPMTYSIEGFRNIIAGNQLDMLKSHALVLACFLIGFMICTMIFYIFFFKKNKDNMVRHEESLTE
ncbi:putative membrane protein [Scopulibacillus darangshiensis]|uniref:Putative membrane protein n=1 Tax=Scopulibacillus darangshiensis TaxID=442528 RepID=A0A4R2P3A4_9BACL|nr:YhgE/Pip domain-containing protein [Scopulibacillus darangshiensis]TCP29259.1 putative membrane protein [Scopulibacillus darangshiensis]